MPISMMTAIWLKMLIVTPYSLRPNTAPSNASGTVTMMMTGCTKLSNCAASTRNTTASAKQEREVQLLAGAH